MDFVFRRSYRGPIKLAVFDWSGTTIDYGCLAPTVVFIDVFKQRGVESTIEQSRAPMGLMKKDHIRAISRHDDVVAQWRKVHGQDCQESDVEDMFEKDFKRQQLECIANYTQLIPGTLECIAELKRRGIKIGSTTGYFTEAMQINLREAAKQGYSPDSNFCASDVPAGRPEPWMLLANMQATRTFPPEAVIKIGDTQPDVGEGLNAGAWTIGVSKTGNEVGLSEEELGQLTEQEQDARIARAERTLRQCGAHYVVEGIKDVPRIVDLVHERLRVGERP